MDWNDYSFVMRSKLRLSILENIKDKPKTPTQLKNELNQSITLISRYLSQLKRRGLITCLTEGERMWKLFAISEKGKEILAEVK